MTAIESHRTALKWATELLESVMADVTDEQMAYIPPGLANPIGALYAHAVCAADGINRGSLQGDTPLFAGPWAGRTGISEPTMFLDLAAARNLKVDLAAAREYAQAVYADIHSYVASLSDADLERDIDLSQAGLGIRSLDWCVSALITSHFNNMAGEISALKGVQGAKGYPF